MDNNDILVTFWGVRGSCPTFDENVFEYGGNTSCVEVKIKDRLIILDGGTGIQQLGKYLSSLDRNIKGDIFITHTHWDHIQGLPFFSPFFNRENYFNIYGEKKNDISFSKAIKEIMKYPYCPIEWEDLDATLIFNEIGGDETLDIGDDITIKTIHTDHPGGCLAYRINYNGKSISYITDLEHNRDIHNSLKEFVFNTDILIYDANFTDVEYYGGDSKSSKKGWGHSTWEKGVSLAKEAKIKKMILFHHNSNRKDSELKVIEKEAKKYHNDLMAAKEGMTIAI